MESIIMRQELLDAIAWARGSKDLDLLWDLIHDLEDFLRETEQ
jgi:hypothetical protein